MNMNKPSPAEKERAIEFILSKGLVQPKSLWHHLYEMYRNLGFKHLFLNTWYPVILSIVLMVGFLYLCPLSPEKFKYTVLFAAAPVFFIFVVLLTEIIEWQDSGLYELKMTCKYTIQQIAAFRVLCFSLMGTMLSTLTVLFSKYSDATDLFRSLSLSLSALFLCSYLSIWIMRSFTSRWNHFTPLLIWIVMTLCPLWILKERWELFLSQIPLAITLFVALILFALFMMELKKLIKIQTREVAYDVGR